MRGGSDYERSVELGRRSGTTVWIMRGRKLFGALADEQKPAVPNDEQTSD